MPNWCQNRVTFTGDADQIKEIRELFTNEEPFNTIIPQPADEDLPKAEDSLSLPDWYMWRVNTWGTKWDIDSSETHFAIDENNFLQIEFFTAWSPAVGICEKLREKYEDVDIIWFYDEPGMCDAGYI
jgi:hypothetical protein